MVAVCLSTIHLSEVLAALGQELRYFMCVLYKAEVLIGPRLYKTYIDIYIDIYGCQGIYMVANQKTSSLVSCTGRYMKVNVIMS